MSVELSLIEMANRLQETITREVMSWAFATKLASAIGYGRLEIIIKDHRVERAELVWSMKADVRDQEGTKR